MFEIIVFLTIILVIFFSFLLFYEPKKERPLPIVRRSVFVVNEEEAAGNFISTLRPPDSGKHAYIMELNDEVFEKNVFIYWSGVVRVNERNCVINKNEMTCDVARKLDEPWKIIFADNLGEGDVIQIIIF